MIDWKVTVLEAESYVSVMGQGASLMEVAAASAEMLTIDQSFYGVPADVPPEKVYRFSRVVAKPRGKGGGSVVLEAALRYLDHHGLWAVLEASPYPGTTPQALYAFYERHGFRHNPRERGLMFRPPGGHHDPQHSASKL